MIFLLEKTLALLQEISKEQEVFEILTEGTKQKLLDLERAINEYSSFNNFDNYNFD